MLSTSSIKRQIPSINSLLILSLVFSNLICLGQDQQFPSQNPVSDGILSVNENVDSSIFQSHWINRVNEIMYDKEALKDYITAQIESLKYSSASNSSNLPLDLEIFGDQVQIGTKVIVRRFDYSGKKIKVPVYRKRWETYYAEILVPIHGSGRSSRTIRNSSDPYGRTIKISEKPIKYKKKRVRQKRLISRTLVRYKTGC